LLLAISLSAAAAPRIWFVDNRRQEGDGSVTAPFPTIAAASAASAEGDAIFVLRGTGPYREQVVLRARQLLAGEGMDVTAQLTARELAAPAALSAVAAMPAIEGGEGDAVTLAPGSAVAGLDVRATSGRALVANAVSGDVTVHRVMLSAADGIAVAIEGGDANIVFEASPIAVKSGSAIAVRNRTGGTVSFRGGSTITVAAGVKPALALQDNRGEIVFADAVQLTTGGACAICIGNSGRVAITAGTSAISTARATAVEITKTAVDIYLRDVSADANTARVARAIALEDASGTFRVDGGKIRGFGEHGVSLVRSSGVSLRGLAIAKSATAAKNAPHCGDLSARQNELACGAAIYLQDARDVALNDIRIGGSAQAGLFGDGVANLTIDKLTIEDAGDETGEHGIAIRELHGKSVFVGVSVTDSAARQLFVANKNGEGSLELRNSRLDGGPPPHGGQGLLLQLSGEAKFALAVDNSDLVGHFSDAIHAVASESSDLDLVVHGSRFHANNSAVNLVADRDARVQYRIANNVITSSASSAVNIAASLNRGTSNGTIADNTIGRTGVPGSGAKCGSCGGIRVAASREGKSSVTLRGNTIQHVAGFGIRVQTNGASALRTAITGNTIRHPDGISALNAISVQSGARPADTTRLCADVLANRIAGAWDPQGSSDAILLTSKGATAMSVVGGEGSALAQQLRARNNGAAANIIGNATAVKSCQ
jgi:hypothetical protein